MLQFEPGIWEAAGVFSPNLPLYVPLNAFVHLAFALWVRAARKNSDPPFSFRQAASSILLWLLLGVTLPRNNCHIEEAQTAVIPPDRNTLSSSSQMMSLVIEIPPVFWMGL